MIGIREHFHQLLAAKSWKAIKEELGSLDAVQISRLIEHLPEDDGAVLFRLLPRNLAKGVFQRLSHKEQENIIKDLAANAERLAALLNDLDPDAVLQGAQLSRAQFSIADHGIGAGGLQLGCNAIRVIFRKRRLLIIQGILVAPVDALALVQPAV